VHYLVVEVVLELTSKEVMVRFDITVVYYAVALIQLVKSL